MGMLDPDLASAIIGALMTVTVVLFLLILVSIRARQVSGEDGRLERAAEWADSEIGKMEARLGIRNVEAAHVRTIGLTAAIVVALLGLGLTGNAGGALLGVAGVAVLVPILMKMRSDQTTSSFSEQLGDALPVIAASLRSGTTLSAALNSYSLNAQEPIKGELERVSSDVLLGKSFADALYDMAGRMESSDAKMLATTVAVQSSTGAGLADIIDDLAGTIKERQRLRKKADALTATNRLSAKFLTVLPIALFIFFVTTNSDFSKFYSSPNGLITICVMALLLLTSTLILNKITDLKVD